MWEVTFSNWIQIVMEKKNLRTWPCLTYTIVSELTCKIIKVVGLAEIIYLFFVLLWFSRMNCSVTMSVSCRNMTVPQDSIPPVILVGIWPFPCYLRILLDYIEELHATCGSGCMRNLLYRRNHRTLTWRNHH